MDYILDFIEQLDDSGEIFCFINRFGLNGNLLTTYTEVAEACGKSETWAYEKVRKVERKLYDWCLSKNLIKLTRKEFHT